MGKIYAVKSGRKTGIFYSWSDCEAQVKGVSGAEFKSFGSEEEANVYLYGGIRDGSLGIKKVSTFDGYLEKPYNNDLNLSEDNCIAYVDGSYNTEGYYGFGCLLYTSDKEFQLAGCDNVPYLSSMQNISGELLGAMVAVTIAINLGKKKITLYHDLEGTQKWADREWKRNKQGTIQYEDFIDNCRLRIDIEFKWVKGHTGIVGNEAADNLARQGLSNRIKVHSRDYFCGGIQNGY